MLLDWLLSGSHIGISNDIRLEVGSNINLTRITDFQAVILYCLPITITNEATLFPLPWWTKFNYWSSDNLNRVLKPLRKRNVFDGSVRKSETLESVSDFNTLESYQSEESLLKMKDFSISLLEILPYLNKSAATSFYAFESFPLVWML